MLSTFLSTPEEWHALVIGLCEVICPWPAYHKFMNQARQIEIFDEYHYYMFGRAIGVYAWLIMAYIIKLLFT